METKKSIANKLAYSRSTSHLQGKTLSHKLNTNNVFKANQSKTSSKKENKNT